MLFHLVTLALVINIFLLPDCFVHRVDAKPPVFRDGILVLSFLRARVSSLMRRSSKVLAKLAADTHWDSTYGLWPILL